MHANAESQVSLTSKNGNALSKVPSFLRGKTWWVHDSKPDNGKTCEQWSLKTKVKAEADRLLASMNEPYRFAAYNLQMARTHLQMCNPDITRRTWGEVMDAVVKTKRGKTTDRYERATKDKAFDSIRKATVIETAVETLFDVKGNGVHGRLPATVAQLRFGHGLTVGAR